MSASIRQTGRRPSVLLAGDSGARPTITISIVDDADMMQEPANDAGPDTGSFDRNIAADMDGTSLAALAGWLIEGIEADIQSRKEWEDTANIAADYLGITLNEPTTSVSADGTITKTISTCMQEAQWKLWSTARAELLPVGGPIKVRRDDAPIALKEAQSSNDPWDRDLLADALAIDMNHYLTVTDKEYYPDTSRMLSNRCLIGNAFKKVYRCPIKRRPRSVWVKAVNLIVSNDCAHLSGASRVTERIRLSQSMMRRLQTTGHYLDVALSMPSGTATEAEIAEAETIGISATPQLPEDFEHHVYECYCDLGSGTANSLIGDLSRLDRDETGKKPGFPLPYRVSIDVDSRTILEIRRDWKQGDDDYERRRHYVKYGFLPNPLGGFYDLGLIHVVGNPTLMATMLLRSGTDAALFSNFPAFIQLKGPGSRQSNTVYRPNPGEVVTMDAGGAQKIQDAIMKFPFEPPSAQSMGLLQKAEGDVRRIAGVIELPVGEGRMGNVPVGTIMSYVEAIAQVPGAVHKDDHISQQEEFELLRDLFAEDPASLVRGNRTPAKQWQTAAEISDPDLVPAADPNTPSQIHRLMKVQAGVTVAGLPQFTGIPNQRAVYRKAMRTIFGGDEGEFEMPEQPAPPPQPDPKVQVAQINAQAKLAQVQAQGQKSAADHQFRLAELQEEGIQRAQDRDSEETRAALQLQGKKVQAAHDTVNAALDRGMDHAHKVMDASQPDQPPGGGDASSTF